MNRRLIVNLLVFSDNFSSISAISWRRIEDTIYIQNRGFTSPRINTRNETKNGDSKQRPWCMANVT